MSFPPADDFLPVHPEESDSDYGQPDEIAADPKAFVQTARFGTTATAEGTP